TSTLYERTRGTPTAALAASIDASLNAVEDIMSTLLDISRMDSGALKVTRTNIDIFDLLRKIEIEFQPLASEKDIELRVIGASLIVRSDRMLLARVIQNLVSNAIKYTRPGGRVLVGCRRRGESVRIDVIDTGIGIDRHQHQLLLTDVSRLEEAALHHRQAEPQTGGDARSLLQAREFGEDQLMLVPVDRPAHP